MSYSSTAEKLALTFSLKKCKEKYYYSISIIMEDNSSGYKENFETEIIMCKQNNSEIIFTQKMLCNYFFEKKQSIKIIMKKNIPVNSIIKTTTNQRLTSLSSLITSQNSIYERKLNENKEDSEIVCIKIERDNSNSDNYKSLFKYFKSGLKLSCFLSLDFCENNNNPSLHDTKINYLNIFKYISNIISNYTRYKFYLSGFNGKIKNAQSNKTVFNLNMNEKDSSVNTIDKVINFFNMCLEQNLIKPEKNNHLSSIIKKITNEIYKLYEIRYYNVSFIITRGVIEQNDIKKTLDAIIESSYLPLTIIIIGVGKNDYSQMKKILSKDKKYSSLGMEKMRNNVLFTSLIDDFSNNAEKLIYWCLEELSKQMLDYYDLVRSPPNHIYENNLKNIKESFNLFNSSICLERSEIVTESDLMKINEKRDELILGKSISPFFNDNNNPDKPNEDIKEINKMENIKYDNKIIIKENPYKNDVSLSNLSESNKSNINIDDNIFNEFSSKKYINKKPTIYKSVLDNNNKNNSDNNKNNNNNTNNNTNNNSNNNDNCSFIYTPTPTPNSSINPDIKYNPYDTPGGPELNNYKNKKFNITTKSILDQNQDDNNYNPYAEELKKQNVGNVGNIEKSSNSMGQKKMNNISDISAFNSTKNSENIKASNYFLFNNYSIDSSQMK